MDDDAVNHKLLSQIPIKALKTSTRNKLSEMLNSLLEIPMKNGMYRDWRGIAELTGWSHDDVESAKWELDPVGKVLNVWQNSMLNCPSVSHFVQLLETIGRYDVVDDLLPMFESDGEEYTRRNVITTSTNFSEVSITPVDEKLTSSASWQEQSDRRPFTVDDVKLLTETGEVQTYDAYVCYTDSDLEFVVELQKKLEEENNFKLCIPNRDLLGGVFAHEAKISLIESRCRRMLLVISPDFLTSPQLNFQYMFAHALSVEEQKRRIIPIIYKPCDLPQKFRFLATLNYSRGDMFNCFWERLVQSIRENNVSMSNDLFPVSRSANNLLNSAAFSADSGRPLSNALTEPRLSLPSPSSCFLNSSPPWVTAPPRVPVSSNGSLTPSPVSSERKVRLSTNPSQGATGTSGYISDVDGHATLNGRSTFYDEEEVDFNGRCVFMVSEPSTPPTPPTPLTPPTPPPKRTFRDKLKFSTIFRRK